MTPCKSHSAYCILTQHSCAQSRVDCMTLSVHCNSMRNDYFTSWSRVAVSSYSSRVRRGPGRSSIRRSPYPFPSATCLHPSVDRHLLAVGSFVCVHHPPTFISLSTSHRLGFCVCVYVFPRLHRLSLRKAPRRHLPSLSDKQLNPYVLRLSTSV